MIKANEARELSEGSMILEVLGEEIREAATCGKRFINVHEILNEPTVQILKDNGYVVIYQGFLDVKYTIGW